MRRLMITAGIAVVAAAAVAAAAVAAARGQQPRAVPYPDGYRSWQHVKSMVLLPEHPLAGTFGGIHHVYANRAALGGLRSGRYPDGAVLVFDLLEARSGEGAISEGARRLVGVMRRDARAYAATGGWGYEGFAGDSRTARLVTDGGASCHACHTARAAQQFVYSEYRD